MKYRREIDGLRALAVIPVIFFHAGIAVFSGGYIGVDVFFVISGYLITTIIVAELKEGSFSVASFYERRARRILPALFFVILVVIPFAWMLLAPFELISFSKSISAVSLFVSNFFFWKDGGYFETAAELKPLLHTWSLAVEEQYYILFPIFLMALWKYGRKTILLALIFLVIVSLSIAQVGSTLKPVPNFFLLPSRAWELAIGAIAAFFLLGNRNLKAYADAREMLALLGFAAIVTSIFLFDNETPFPSFYSLLPTVGAVLIIIFASKDTYIGMLLGSRPFVSVGLVSYSAYLWHQPILALAKAGMPLIGEIPKIVLLGLIFILSVFSWKYIEIPFRNGGLFGRKIIFYLSVVATVFFAAFGFYSYKSLLNINNEASMARELVNGAAIYASNINERKFIKYRIELETILPKTIVLGSSRIMQIGSQSIGAGVLNFSVSGSTVEDDVAIWKLASEKFEPDLVLIGADPWLFNAKSGQERWRTLQSEYYSGLSEIGIKTQGAPTLVESNTKEINNFLVELYRYLNIAKITAATDAPEHMDKILRDGSRVYNLTYVNKTNVEIERDAVSYATYAMYPYEYSVEAENAFKKLIMSIKQGRKVILVLSPYHPKLYNFMTTKDKKFLEIERKFKVLGAGLGIPVIGSYDPAAIGCSPDEFYDGMHPKASCMDRVIALLKQ